MGGLPPFGMDMKTSILRNSHLCFVLHSEGQGFHIQKSYFLAARLSRCSTSMFTAPIAAGWLKSACSVHLCVVTASTGDDLSGYSGLLFLCSKHFTLTRKTKQNRTTHLSGRLECTYSLIQESITNQESPFCLATSLFLLQLQSCFLSGLLSFSLQLSPGPVLFFAL